MLRRRLLADISSSTADLFLLPSNDIVVPTSPFEVTVTLEEPSLGNDFSEVQHGEGEEEEEEQEHEDAAQGPEVDEDAVAAGEGCKVEDDDEKVAGSGKDGTDDNCEGEGADVDNVVEEGHGTLEWTTFWLSPINSSYSSTIYSSAISDTRSG
mmetsp:Transcript_46623/g.83420  ORF Transcript_46623/g.83420 Transcript_46623/m.83420 type:complete len:153 (-) Transcript_46623:3752-4210(-)